MPPQGFRRSATGPEMILMLHDEGANTLLAVI